MRFSGGKFLILVCLSFFQCNGAPPREVATKVRGVNFTDEEDVFLLREVSGLSVRNQHMSSNLIWDQVAAEHRKKWEQNTPGFPQARSKESLRRHFRSMLETIKISEIRNQVPEAVLQGFGLDLNRPPPGNRQMLYSPEEENFIIEEVLKPSCTRLHAFSTWEAIHANHDIKRQAQTPGFVHERTAEGLHSHYGRMQQNNQVPEEVMKKFWKQEKGIIAHYSPQEDEFLIEELLKPSCSSLYSSSTRTAILDKHNMKRQAQTPGFENERTLESIRSHVEIMQRNGLLPIEVLKKSRRYREGASSSNPTPANQQTVLEVSSDGDEDEDE